MTAFDALFVPDELRAAVSADAWLDAMLEFECALAEAGRKLGLVPAEAVAAIAAVRAAGSFDADAIWADGRAVGNPAEPLVRALRARVGDAERYVHLGATSQDVVDSAAMLVAGRALAVIVAAVDEAAAACAALAQTHRQTPTVGRTLLQHAVPTTFGLKAAGWLDRLLDAREALVGADGSRAVQLGGAAGTLSGYGADGVKAVELVAATLGLAVPVLPWHASRTRVNTLGAALALAAGVSSGIAFDVVLLAQTEVAEVEESAAGGSSAMPHKRNPVHAVLARGAARVAAANCSVLTDSVEHEHERAAGAWHAEWEALSVALLYTGASVAELGHSLDGLVVNVDRMRANLELTGGLIYSERVAAALAERVGRQAAHGMVADAVGQVSHGASFKAVLLAIAGDGLTEAEIDGLLDPATIVDTSGAFVDRALARYRSAGSA